MFKYYNANPDKKIEKDCVCRAIKAATGLKYSIIDKLLDFVAKWRNCDKLCLDCYSSLLENVFGFKRYTPRANVTVANVANRFCDNIVIMRVDGHLTVAMYSQILDIWDCSDELVDVYWLIE